VHGWLVLMLETIACACMSRLFRGYVLGGWVGERDILFRLFSASSLFHASFIRSALPLNITSMDPPLCSLVSSFILFALPPPPCSYSTLLHSLSFSLLLYYHRSYFLLPTTFLPLPFLYSSYARHDNTHLHGYILTPVLGTTSYTVLQVSTTFTSLYLCYPPFFFFFLLYMYLSYTYYTRYLGIIRKEVFCS
jgi:hypothetical protein